ncbi:MAG: recombination protein RecR [Deltaproteobacteria bacterium]|nr:recombination protein RecR [Deltaproteobacteria bacterium]
MSDAISQLIDLFSRLPGIGKRSAARLVFHIIETDQRFAQKLGDSLKEFHLNIKKCSSCANITDTDPCNICVDLKRESSIVCVVENVPDLWAVNSGGTYRGKFHVLHGLLAPLDGIGPEDLNIKLLYDRVKKESVKEVIIATRPSVEGEATAMLIKENLKDMDVKITRIASGVPHGSELEYIDSNTLERAISGRREF